jgi:peptide/nickel transport system permease protein
MSASAEVVLVRSVTLPKLARALTRDIPTLLALIWMVIVLVSSVAAPFVAPYDRLQQNLAMRNRPPLTPGAEEGGFPHILGTDPLGRDMLSRLIYGARISLAVGASSVLASGILGVLLGLIAGFYGGLADAVIMRVVDAMIAFPTVLFALFVLFVVGPGFVNMIAIMALFRWMTYSRITRSMTLKYREEPFVEGAQAIGAGDARIIFRHILPNLLSPILVLATLEFAVMILSEASLSFLGFGIQPPRSSWGLEAAMGREYLRSAWWLVTFPGLIILLTTLSLNLLATWLRAIGDPEQRWRWLTDAQDRAQSRSRRKADREEQREIRPVPERRMAGTAAGSDGHMLEVHDLRVEFQTLSGVLNAVNGISYTLDEGETLAIVGESGSGKTVSAEAVMGILDSPPGFVTGGSVLFRGADLLKMSRAERREIRGEKMAMVFQDALTALNPGFSVGYQIAEMYRIRRGMSSRRARQKAVECLERVHIPSAGQRIDDFPHQFSGGMRQRVMIAMALALDPEILIADEPTTALDVTVQAQIMELLTDLRADVHMGLILITHDLALVAEVADRVAVMYAGRIMETGLCIDVFERLAHPYTEALMSSIPRSDKKRERLNPIDGAPPDLKQIPSGCPFHPRCVYVNERCQLEEPGLLEVGPNHFIACHGIREA